MNNHPTPPQQRHGHAAGHHPVLHPPFISNSLAIRQEIQRFESVHPSIYAIYDLIDLLPDAQIAQQIRDHVVCIEVSSRSSRSVASLIVDAIESFRERMPCGVESLGIPPLVPYNVEHKEVGVHTESLSLDGEVNKARVDGLDEFEVTEMKVNMILSKVNFQFYWKQISVKSLYDLTAMLKAFGITIDILGNGNMAVDVTDIVVKGTIKYSLGLVGGQIKLKECKIVITLGDVNSEIEGILGKGFVNRKLNEIIEEMVLMAVNENQDAIAETIEALILPSVNGAVDGMSLADIIASVGGGSGGEPTVCIPPTQ